MAVKDLGAVEVPSGAETAFPAPRLRPAQAQGAAERFSDSDGGVDLTRTRFIGPILTKGIKSRKFQFSLILPNQIIFWLVVALGIFGITDPTMNFGTAITWYIWFAMMFTMTLAVGRGWCLMCPFGGWGEWLQRRTFFKRAQKRLGLGWKMPEKWARYGLVISAVVFIAMTWAEEFFNIAGPGEPYKTSLMVLGIVGASTLVFLLFERRTFCRYFCPLSSLIGSAGSNGVIAGFRTRDRQKCLECKTKDCMRGGEKGYGCPWYTYPGTADTNTYCGLCSECYKACPYDNVGVYAQKPLTSVVAPRKRTELAWVVAMMFALVLFQQYNAMGSYAALDDWLNRVMHFPAYPNPVDYLGIIALLVGGFAGISFLLSRAFAHKTQIARAFSSWFAPVMYGLIPLMGADFVARAMPKFFNNAARLPASVVQIFGKTVSWAGINLLPNNAVVGLQVGIAAVGTMASVYAAYKIAGRDLKSLTPHARALRLVSSLVVLAIGAGVIALTILINGAE
jgi:NosR/NirI family nitrous oxide reductase transcriptional regulator